MISYIGIVTVDTIAHNAIIVERSPIERSTAAAALADAKQIIASSKDIEIPSDTITDLQVSFIEVR